MNKNLFIPDAIYCLLRQADQRIVIWSIVPGKKSLRRSVRILSVEWSYFSWHRILSPVYPLELVCKNRRGIIQNKGNQINYKYL
jgi:hypothetical protein